MTSWGMGVSSTGSWFDKPSYLGFWVSRNPWGPWTQVHEETAWTPGGEATALAYQPQISPKWIASDGGSFWLVWTDLQTRTDSTRSRELLSELQRRSNPNAWTEDYTIRFATEQRNHTPYYAFNAQRVDVVLS